MKLLIDADFIVYKCCAAAESEIDFGDDVIVVTSKFSEAYAAVEREIVKIRSEFMLAEPVLFFSDSKNFRKKIYPDYKGHRNRKKPCGYRRVISELSMYYKVIRIAELEADDAMGIYAYTEVTARLTSLETSRELMNSDLLKKSEQTTTDKEQYLLLEDLYETVEKHQELLDKNIHTQVMLDHIEAQLKKALEDIEELKDKVRANGNSH